MTVKSKPFTLLTPAPSLPETPGRLCDADGCMATAEYRAPQDRSNLDSYYWFCLIHVREYNAAWNYYADMSEDEIEQHIRADTTWRRPTWPLGARGAHYNRAAADGPKVDFGAFAQDDWTEQPHRNGGHANGRRSRPGSSEEKALAIFNLEPPVTQEDIKARYKNLVKKYHPDTNGGSKDAEERLKTINQAYSMLKNGIAW